MSAAYLVGSAGEAPTIEGRSESTGGSLTNTDAAPPPDTYDDRSTADFTFVVEGRDIFVHKSALHQGSPFLSRFLSEDPLCSRIHTTNAKYAAMDIVLRAMYANPSAQHVFGVHEHNATVVLSAWEIAMHFEMPHMSNAATTRLIAIASRIHSVALLKAAIKYDRGGAGMASSSTTTTTETQDWQTQCSRALSRHCISTLMPPQLTTDEDMKEWTALLAKYPSLAGRVQDACGLTAGGMAQQTSRSSSSVLVGSDAVAASGSGPVRRTDGSPPTSSSTDGGPRPSSGIAGIPKHVSPDLPFAAVAVSSAVMRESVPYGNADPRDVRRRFDTFRKEYGTHRLGSLTPPKRPSQLLSDRPQEIAPEHYRLSGTEVETTGIATNAGTRREEGHGTLASTTYQMRRSADPAVQRQRALRIERLQRQIEDEKNRYAAMLQQSKAQKDDLRTKIESTDGVDEAPECAEWLQQRAESNDRLDNIRKETERVNVESADATTRMTDQAAFHRHAKQYATAAVAAAAELGRLVSRISAPGTTRAAARTILTQAAQALANEQQQAAADLTACHAKCTSLESSLATEQKQVAALQLALEHSIQQT